MPSSTSPGAHAGPAGADLVIVSNRGPLSFALDTSGRPVPVGTAGGLAGTLHTVVRTVGATWVASAMSDADRKASADGLMVEEGLRIVTVEPDPALYRMAYDVVSNSTLWFCHHHLFDLTRRPVLDHRWDEAWDAYRALNAAFAQTVAATAERGATVLVQDYHLCLVPRMVAALRPDVRCVHFTHTPFADPAMWRVLPQAVAVELLAGMAGGRACGFHTARWEAAFRACCEDSGIDPGATFVSALGPDPDELAARASSPACRAARERVDALVGDRPTVLRVDRMEPSKNLLRGFWAFAELLRSHPEHRGEIVQLALAYPSRQSLPTYLAYASEVQHAAQRVNDEFGTPDWQPIVLDVADDAERSFAALTRYDLLLVNPLRDGMNLVAKEGPLVNTRDGVLALSREAGSFDELHRAALAVNPFDVVGTAAALHDGLTMPAPERKRRATDLRALSAARHPEQWLTELQRAAGS